MNLERAREYYSEYQEGILDSGLKTAFESALRANPEIQADYDDFCRAMARVDTLRDEPIEIPFDLHERISAKLDHHLWEKKQAQKAPWQLGWRGWLTAGLAATILVGTIISFGPSASRVAMGGLGPQGQAKLEPQEAGLELRDGNLVLVRASGTAETLLVKSGLSGDTFNRIVIPQGAGLESPLVNANAQATLLSVWTEDGNMALAVAVPGLQRSAQVSGQGTSVELALAAADVYGVPVVLQLRDTRAAREWNLDGSVENRAAQLLATGLQVEEREDGILVLSD